MFEKNLIIFLKAFFKEIPVYAFFIPENAPETAVCFENAGRSEHTKYYDGEELQTRTIKLTVSSNDVSKIFDDSELTKYIVKATNIGALKILQARITGSVDNFNDKQKLYERTYSISFKLMR